MVGDNFRRIRQSLVTGILVIAPLALTIWGLFFLVNLADNLLNILPPSLRPEHIVGFPIPGLGLLLVLLILFVVGGLARLYVGRRVIEGYEAFLKRVPVVSSVYAGLKQFLETIFSGNKTAFSQAVLIEYPRSGVYSLAFVTNETSPIQSLPRLVSVFLPTTPNPTSGFFLMLPRKDIRYLDIATEEAFTMIMSAGLVVKEPLAFRVAEQSEKSERAETIIADDQVIDQGDIE
ncbi:MAG: hypothetical protein CL916_05325 [Deltaproteobacteria bacterium]|nr:hypothetical protein [Deltaproteobacteria bacterium]